MTLSRKRKLRAITRPLRQAGNYVKFELGSRIRYD